MTSDINTCTLGSRSRTQTKLLNQQHGNENKVVFKKGSNKKKLEPDGDEEQFNDELQGFRRNLDSEYQVVEETMEHPTQKLAE